MPRDPAKRRASKQRYQQSDKGKATAQAYDQSDKGKAAKQRYDQSVPTLDQGTFKGVWLNAEHTEWALEKEQQ
jgi:hypothetical protein